MAATQGPLRVLVVDDDLATRAALTSAVRSFGFACAEASDGEEAWVYIRSTTPDIVIADWHMPVCDGLELCRRIRSNAIDEGPYTYFILMTAMRGERGFLQGTEAGADDYQTKPIDLEELSARLVSATRVVHLHRRVSAKAADLRRDSQTALRAARTDPLTHLANRLELDEHLERAWSESRRYGHRFALAMCDLDDFKQYNDGCGHLAGDDALRRVAQSMQDLLRESDVVYRYGGEEFLALLPEQSANDAAAAMERVRLAIAALNIYRPGTGEAMTVSIGVAALGGEASIAQWIDRADKALYRAKEAGKNRVVLADPGAANELLRVAPRARTSSA